MVKVFSVGILYIAFVVLSCLFCAVGNVSAQQNFSKKYEIKRPSEGERCIICGVLLTENDVVYIIRGRRVPLNLAMADSFLKTPDVYFKKLQPRGALFQEEFDSALGAAIAGFTSGWFLGGLYILAGLIFGGISAYVAIGKGLAVGKYFFMGFFFNVFGFLYLLAHSAKIKKGSVPKGLRKVPATHSSVICSVCGNENHPSAGQCSGCGIALKPLVKSEVSKV